ncbi:hypothetical protein BUMB_02030 [Candidatus Paraburkholderia calva]|nr:hypothetical protein BUMB_02030 [Candidatus Paraburkholderia calva]
MNLAVARHNDRVEKRILSALLAISMAFNGYYMMSSKYIPYIVETDKIGNIISVGAADRANPVDNKRVIREQMINWVENARLIVGDQADGKRFQKWVYARVQERSAAKTALDRFILSADHSRRRRITRSMHRSRSAFRYQTIRFRSNGLRRCTRRMALSWARNGGRVSSHTRSFL